MTLLVRTLLSMVFFAANSVLCRLALLDAQMAPASYTAIRVGSGALLLWALCAGRLALAAWPNGPGRPGEPDGSPDGPDARDSPRTRETPGTPGSLPALWRAGDWPAALALLAYMACFSWAYVDLPAAAGTLVIAVAVQGSMFGLGLLAGERPGRRQGLGLGLALAGLVALVLPGLSAPPLGGALVIFVAGAAWGVYSVRGRTARDPLAATAGNFLRAAPCALLLPLLAGDGLPSGPGVAYAVAAGALASAVGYVLWYAVVARLSVTTAAVVQLCVPPITAAGGALFLGEAVTARLAASSLAILGGVFLCMTARRAPAALVTEHPRQATPAGTRTKAP
ncbi:DMT family transporter [Nitratidesulfovibrio sp. 1201_IL3209]|uniref:DMT family transporter n=1 Tax=Nitratidesulfovibrio sp. 1201_IL3209 TaxID=3084053 RepID=UPI002FD93EA4